MAYHLFSWFSNTSLDVSSSAVTRNWKWLFLSRFTMIVLSHMSVWCKWNTAFRDYVEKSTFFGINVRWSHCNDFTLHFYDFGNLTYWTSFVYLLENLNFYLQSSQAGGEYPQLHRAAGLAEAHRLLSQISIWRWPSRTCEEEELEEGYKWRRCCWWGWRLNINNVTVMRCVSKVCYLWLALLFLKTVRLLHVLNVSVGHIEVSNQIACEFEIVLHNMYLRVTLRMLLCLQYSVHVICF